MRALRIGSVGTHSLVGGLLALTVLASLTIGCKKEDVAAAAAEQAREEAADRPQIADEVDITAIGLPIYPGAEARKNGQLSRVMPDGAAFGHLVSYASDDSFERVLAWYKGQMDNPLVTETATDGGRSASLRGDTATGDQIVASYVVLSESGDEVEIRIAVEGRKSHFAVYLDAVDFADEDPVVEAIAQWRQGTTEGGEEWTITEQEVAKEEARKLLNVLPRPVDSGLEAGTADELKEILEAAGGAVRILPPPDSDLDFRGPRFTETPGEPELSTESEEPAPTEAEESPLTESEEAPTTEQPTD